MFRIKSFLSQKRDTKHNGKQKPLLETTCEMENISIWDVKNLIIIFYLSFETARHSLKFDGALKFWTLFIS